MKGEFPLVVTMFDRERMFPWLVVMLLPRWRKEGLISFVDSDSDACNHDREMKGEFPLVVMMLDRERMFP